MLVPNCNYEIPEMTVKVAQAAFPKGNPYLTLRDELGPIFEDKDFINLYPNIGQPTLAPWRLAFSFITRNTSCNLPIEEDGLYDNCFICQNSVPMCHKGLLVGRVFRSESRQVIGFLIQLMLKKDGKVIVYNIA
jgi:hypothetical protein